MRITPEVQYLGSWQCCSDFTGCILHWNSTALSEKVLS